MTRKLLKNIMTIFSALIVSGTLSCCSDDAIIDSTDTIVGNADKQSGDYAFAFEISLDAISDNATRSMYYGDDINVKEGEEYENVIDIIGNSKTENGEKKYDFRILFFDKNDNFLFEPDDYAINQIEDYDYDVDNNIGSGAKSNRWRIEIPEHVLIRNGAYGVIMDEGFKIAVLANWPRYGNNDNQEPLTFQKGEKLYKISHYWYDSFYATQKLNGEEVFHFLTEFGDNKGLMGATFDWVENGYVNQDAAAYEIHFGERKYAHQLIRKNNGGLNSHTYKHIWRVWNFGNDSFLSENNEGVSEEWPLGEQWSIANDTEKKSILATVGENGLNDYAGFSKNEKENDGLNLGTYISFNGQYAPRTEQPGVDKVSWNEEGGYITLQEGLTYDEHAERTNQLVASKITGFHLRAFAAGTLRIVAKKADGVENASIGIQKRKDYGNGNSNLSQRPNTGTLTEDFQTFEIPISPVSGEINPEYMPGEPLDIYIYSVGGAVDFAQIEYYEDRRLYDTDRQGVLVDKDHLIPMYGIQEFAAIGGYLTPGETLNLSEPGHTYPHKKVYLLRSLAKVELYLPADWNPTHIYMRSNNRTNRCEPMDVSTPTEILWNGGTYNGHRFDGVKAELDRIQDYGSFYKAGEKNLTVYQNKLSWFYGAWQERNNDEVNEKTWAFNYNSIPTNSGDYPRIYNARINRSDYTLFRKMETKDGYTRYILYVGEKNIEDPNTHGEMDDSPKVPHIEMRFNGINDDANLDDNDCYRIYFVRKQPDIERSEMDDYETKLEDPYPIMRNYIYRFKVTGINSKGNPNVGLQICTPAERNVPSITFD